MKYALLLVLALLSSAGQQDSRSDPQSKRAPEERIFVHGAVRNSGRFVLPAKDYTILHLTMDAAAGADLNEVLVVRQDKTTPLVLEIDVRNMMVTGDTTWNVTLRDGDVVHFRKEQRPRAAEPVGPERADTGSRRAR